jgi:hypothetical protein
MKKNNLISAGTLSFGYDIKMMQKFIFEKYSSVIQKQDVFKVIEVDNPYKIIGELYKYHIYPNGDCYNETIGRFIKKVSFKSHNREFLRYKIDGKNHYINRIVMFYFGNHNFKSILDLPMVTPIDKNPFNNHVDNLKFANQSELNKKYGIRVSNPFIGIPKISSSEIQKVKEALKNNCTLKILANYFEVSEMSVHRFIKRHNLKQSKI